MSKHYRTVCITFDGHAGDATDHVVMEILDRVDGEFINAGTFLGTPMKRDIEWRIHKDRIRVVDKTLKTLGVNVAMEVKS
jgi:hypothetical protein